MEDNAFAAKSLTADKMAMITKTENLLVLSPHPGDEAAWCGGLIAECCRRGRPPFVIVVDDGSQTGPEETRNSPDELARLHERETRDALERLGLPSERLLMMGLYEGTVPSSGPVFEAIVNAVAVVMWARDCGIICSPAANAGDPEHILAHRIAAEVAARSGVGHLAYLGDSSVVDGAWPLNIAPRLQAKQAGIASHKTALLAPNAETRHLRQQLERYETFAEISVSSADEAA